MKREPRYAVIIAGEGIDLETDSLTRAKARFQARCAALPHARVSLQDGLNHTIVARQEGTEEDASV